MNDRCWNCGTETEWRNEHDVPECRECREELRCHCGEMSACVPPNVWLCVDCLARERTFL